jgi:glycosyltransferase involved in cell wall biosynthesis
VDAGQNRVVICVRAHDRPFALRRAIAGVVAQTHQNWVLSIFNNCGDPELIESVVEEFAEAIGDRVVLTHSPRLHVSAALRGATEVAGGEFLAVHDDDDDWAPHFLEKTVAALIARPDDVAVASRATVVSEVRHPDADWVELARDPNAYDWLKSITLENAVMRCPVPPICVLVRRNAWDAAGAHSLDHGYAGDWHALLRLLGIGPISVLEENLAFYFLGETESGVALNLSHSGDVKYSDAMMREDLLRTAPVEGAVNLAQIVASISVIDRENHASLVEALEHLRTIRADVDHIRLRLAHLEDRVDRLDPTGRRFWNEQRGRFTKRNG